MATAVSILNTNKNNILYELVSGEVAVSSVFARLRRFEVDDFFDHLHPLLF
jgi:hypothetical protein